MINFDRMQRQFEESKHYSCGESQAERLANWNVWKDAWKAGLASQAQQLSGNSVQLASQAQQPKEPEKCVQCGVRVDNSHCLGDIWNCSAMQSQAQQESQAANLLLLKLEIESICDAFKYAEDAKCKIQELDVSKFLSLPPTSQAQQTESKPSIEDIQSLVDSSSTMLKWCVKNVQQWSFSEYDWLRSATEKVKATLPPAPEGDKHE